MSDKVLIEFGERMVAGLQKKAATIPSRWTLDRVRNVDSTACSFRRFPWQKEMLDSKAPHNCACKGAQLGISHCVLCRAMFANDVEKRDVLYVLPALHPDASNFSNARFDVLVKASPYLSDIYDRGNVGLKRTSTNCFYIRGAQSRSGGKSVPAGFLALDEIDEIPKWFITLVRERMSGQEVKTEWDISTPTVPEHGIDKLWLESTQEHFFFPCPSCSTSGPNGSTQPRLIQLFITNLAQPECLEIVGDDPDSTRTLTESYLKCPECGAKLEHKAKPELFKEARFIAAVAGKEKRGFHVNQLYSTTVTPGEVAAAALRASYSEIESQEFWNSKMGRAHAPEGAKVTESIVNQCRGTHLNGQAMPAHSVVTMGVDVGSWNHFEICEWKLGDFIGDDPNTMATPRVLKTGKVRSFEELDTFMLDYRINMAVVDSMPDTRKSYEFAQRFWGFVKMCYYSMGVQGKVLVESSWEKGEPIINVNRTFWMDVALGRYKSNRIILPQDLPQEYVEHVRTPTRIIRFNKDGNPVASWFTPDGKADHHAHARTYCEIALRLALSMGQNEDIDNPLD